MTKTKTKTPDPTRVTKRVDLGSSYGPDLPLATAVVAAAWAVRRTASYADPESLKGWPADVVETRRANADRAARAYTAALEAYSLLAGEPARYYGRRLETPPEAWRASAFYAVGAQDPEVAKDDR